MAAFAPTQDAPLPSDNYPNIFKPTTLGTLQMRNALIMSPLTRGRTFVGEDRCPNAMMAEYYRKRARHSGMIICEASNICVQGEGWVQSPSLYTQEHCNAWKPIVDAIHGAGALAMFQMWHMGRAAHSSFLEGAPPVAPSSICINGATFGSDGTYAAGGSKERYETPRALETAEIPALIESYRAAAVMAKEAGFDGINVHSANGYLLNEFLDSSTNQRTDEYGGSVENRARLLSEVVDAVCTVYDSTTVCVRISPNGVFNDMGAPDSIETYTYVLQMLAGKNLAFVDMMDGLGFGFHQKCDPFTIEAASQVYEGSLTANVGYNRTTSEAVIAAGHAKAVIIGRPFISNPDLGFRWAHDLLESDSNAGTWFTHEAEGYDDYPDWTPEMQEALAKAAEEKAAAEAAEAAPKAEGEAKE